MSIIRNLGKTFRYAAPTVARSLMPNVSSIAKNGVQLMNDSRSFLTDSSRLVKEKGAWRGVGEIVKTHTSSAEKDPMDELLGGGGSIFDALKDGMSSMKKGMTTGDFTPKSNDAFGLGGNDFTNFGDFDFDGDEAITGDNAATGMVQNISQDARTFNNISAPNIITNVTSSKPSKFQQDATIKTIDSIKMGSAVNLNGFTKLNQSLFMLNDNLTKMTTFNVEHTAHFHRQTMVFYTSVESKLEAISNSLKEANELSRARDTFMGITKNSNYKDSEYERVLGGGGFNFKEYFNVLKDKTSLMRSAGSSGIKSTIKDPFSALMSSLIPSETKASMKKFDELVGQLPKLAMLKANKLTRNSDILSELSALGLGLDLDDGKKTKFSLANASKGGAVFNAMTQKSIVTVMPNLLSKILRAVDRQGIYGREELHFDHGTGKFMNQTQATDKFNKEKYNSIDTALKTSDHFDFNTSIDEALKNKYKGSKSEAEMSKMKDSFMQKYNVMFEKMAKDNMYVSAKDAKASNYGMDDNSEEWLFMKDFMGNKRNERMMNSLIPDVRGALDSFNSKINDFNPDSVFLHSLLAGGQSNGNNKKLSSINGSIERIDPIEKLSESQKSKLLNNVTSKLDAQRDTSSSKVKGMKSEDTTLNDIANAIDPDDDPNGGVMGSRGPSKNSFVRFLSKAYNAPFNMFNKVVNKNHKKAFAGIDDMDEKSVVDFINGQRDRKDKFVGFIKKMSSGIKRYTVNPVLDFLLGKKDEDGDRTDGVLDKTFKKINELSEKLFISTKQILFGKEYTDEKGNMKFKVGLVDSFKGYAKEFKDDLSLYFIGKKTTDPETGKIIREGGYVKEFSNSFKEGIINPAKKWFGIEGKPTIDTSKDYFKDKWKDANEVKNKISADTKNLDVMTKVNNAMWGIQASMAVKLFGHRNDQGELMRDENGQVMYGGLVQSVNQKLGKIINKTGSLIFGEFDENGDIKKKGLLSNAIITVKDMIGFGKDQIGVFGNFVKDKVYNNIGPKVWLPFIKEVGYGLNVVTNKFKDSMASGIGWVTDKFKKNTGDAMEKTVRDRLLIPMSNVFKTATGWMGKAISKPLEKFKGWSDNLAEKQAKRNANKESKEPTEAQKKMQAYKEEWLERKKKNKEARDAKIEATRLANRTPSEKALDSIEALNKEQNSDVKKILDYVSGKKHRLNRGAKHTGTISNADVETPESNSFVKQLRDKDKASSGGKTTKRDASFIQRQSAEKDEKKKEEKHKGKITQLLSETSENTGAIKKGFSAFKSFLMTALMTAIGPLTAILKTGVVGGLAKLASLLGAKGLGDSLTGGGADANLDGNGNDRRSRRGRRGGRGSAVRRGARGAGRGIGKGLKSLGKGALKVGKFAGKSLGKFIPGVGLALGAGSAISGAMNADDILGIDPSEVGWGDRLAAGAGGLLDFASFGLLDKRDSANFLKNTFSGGGGEGGSEIPQGRITSRFGFRKSPFTGKNVFHPGTDIALKKGTPVGSMAGGGKVLKTGQDSVLGKHVEVQHANGMTTKYGHLDDISVKKGQDVSQRTVLGKSGNTGKSTGPHLHFEAKKNGKYVNSDSLVKRRAGGTEMGGLEWIKDKLSSAKDFIVDKATSLGRAFGFGSDPKDAIASAKMSNPNKMGPSGIATGDSSSANSLGKQADAQTVGFKKALGGLEGINQEGNLMAKLKNKFDKQTVDTEISPMRKAVEKLFKVVAGGGAALLGVGNDGSSVGGATGDSSGGADSGSVTLSGNGNEEKVWNFFKEKGFSNQAIAGIMGNLRQESGVDPTKKQYGGGPGRGLVQWETHGAKGTGRWDQLTRWAEGSGKDPWALDTQLEYLWKEMTGNAEDKYNAHLLNTKYGGLDAFKNQTDYKKALQTFEKSFERAGKPMYEKRYAYAEDYLKKFGGSNTAVGGVELLDSYNNGLFQGGSEKADGTGKVSPTTTMSTTYPVDPQKYTISSKYGWRKLGNSKDFHNGIDFAAPTGTNILSVADGKVVMAKPYGDAGNTIIIDHQDGTQSRYSHLKNNGFKVSVGQMVKKGDVIGLSGNTGGSTGPHLHFETRRIQDSSKPTTGYIDGNTYSFDPLINFLTGGKYTPSGNEGGTNGGSGGAVAGAVGAVATAFSSLKDWFSNKVKYATVGGKGADGLVQTKNGLATANIDESKAKNHTETKGVPKEGGTEISANLLQSNSLGGSFEDRISSGSGSGLTDMMKEVITILKDISSSNHVIAKKEFTVNLAQSTKKPEPKPSTVKAAESAQAGLFSGQQTAKKPQNINKRIELIASGTV